MTYEPRCWKCQAVTSYVVEDGVRRIYCPNCGVRKRRGRNRTEPGTSGRKG